MKTPNLESKEIDCGWDLADRFGTYGAGFLFLPKKLKRSLLSILFFFLWPNELELSRLAAAELGVTGLAGTLAAVVIVEGALALVDWIEVDGAVEVDMDGAPSLIAAMEGWLALALRL